MIGKGRKGFERNLRPLVNLVQFNRILISNFDPKAKVLFRVPLPKKIQSVGQEKLLLYSPFYI